MCACVSVRVLRVLCVVCVTEQFAGEQVNQFSMILCSLYDTRTKALDYPYLVMEMESDTRDRGAAESLGLQIVRDCGDCERATVNSCTRTRERACGAGGHADKVKI